MLLHLSIRNYALIRSLELDFRSGFTILTGETGAGKSILLGALNLLLGERADAAGIQNASEKCIVEGKFNLTGDGLKAFFEEHNLDLEEECILRREIAPGGKSRAFVNDTPVNLQQLKQLGSLLVDIHGQHDTILINQDAFRIQFIDGPAGALKQQKLYEQIFSEWTRSEKLLRQLKAQQDAIARESDFIRFQLDELEGAVLNEGELQQAEEEFRWLNNASEIGKILSQAVHITDDEAQGVQTQLSLLAQLIRQAERLSNEVEPLAAKLAELNALFSDFSFALSREAARCEANPLRLEQLAERIDTINRLLHKHRAKSEGELLDLQRAYAERLRKAESLDADIEAQETAVGKLFISLTQHANDLHTLREKAVSGIEKSMIQLLKSLGIPNVRFEIQLDRTASFDRFGNTRVGLLFSANAGNSPTDISKTASGGERSRVMLAMKKMMAESVELPTIVFDEIDTGVSGAVADAVGEVLSLMGRCMQVLCITHLAQIAAKGDDHLRVLKRSDGKLSETHIERLNSNERIDEIAAMLSGKALTDEARMNAKALILQNQS
jgi:DNA repair protein RecN (Recombination protein N)